MLLLQLSLLISLIINIAILYSSKRMTISITNSVKFVSDMSPQEINEMNIDEKTELETFMFQSLVVKSHIRKIIIPNSIRSGWLLALSYISLFVLYPYLENLNHLEIIQIGIMTTLGYTIYHCYTFLTSNIEYIKILWSNMFNPIIEQ